MKLLLGPRIRRRRKELGLAMEEFAKRIGKSKTWVSDLERGRHKPTDPTMLRKLAFHLQDNWMVLREFAVEDRKSVALNEVSEVAFEEEEEEWVAKPMSFERVEKSAHNTVEVLFPVDASEGDSIDIIACLEDGEETARRLGLKDPIVFVPFEWERPDQEEARVSWTGEAFKVELRQDVVDRARAGEGRDRFTAAHELAHVVLHGELLKSARRPHLFRDIGKMRPQDLKPYKDPEWQANSWASAFLMPYEGAKRFLGRQSFRFELTDFCENFGVSHQAANIRLEKILIRLANDRW